MTKLSTPQRIALLGMACRDSGPALVRIRRPWFRPRCPPVTAKALSRKGMITVRRVTYMTKPLGGGTKNYAWLYYPTAEGYAALARDLQRNSP